MEAFPAVLKEIPNARLIVAGANHHTKAGYWESIREAQPPHLPIEFRGYVPEEDIPELFRTTAVLVLPYDSATGSSGPAHQACEYGVPIIGADIEDFRDMGADEDMAIRFYKVGDATDLANQLITVLRSSELQRSMGQQNFAAGLEMTIGKVVRNYLRWFELNKYKRALLRTTENRGGWFRSLFSRGDAAARPESVVKGATGGDSHGLEPAGNNTQAIDFVDPLV
jgi:glycosyltransferase involved in cell wall biosynthesis